MESLKIILLSVAAAIGYGVAHDQVTIRVCPEYFTLAHAPLFHSGSLTLVALGWGVVATWWRPGDRNRARDCCTRRAAAEIHVETFPAAHRVASHCDGGCCGARRIRWVVAVDDGPNC